MANKTYVLYHAGCYDGYGAAWAAWKKLGTRAEYLPVQHGEPPPPMDKGTSVVIVDFSYSRDILFDLKKAHPDLIVLDHHASALKELEGLNFCTFDMDKSGAMLSWKYFHPKEKVPDLIRYLQDRDLWKFNLHDSKEVSAALRSYPFHFGTWEQLNIKQLAQEGSVILRLQDQVIYLTCKRVIWKDIGGFKAPVVNASAFWSETAERLLDTFPEAPFSAVYWDDGTVRRWSLRSRKGFDVSEIAKKFGGGGHRQAAGFQTGTAVSREEKLILET